MDKILHQFLLGQLALRGDAFLVLRQLGLHVLAPLAHVAGGVLVSVVAEIVFEAVGLLGLAQAVAAAGFGSLIVALVACGVLQNRLERLALTAALIFFDDF